MAVSHLQFNDQLQHGRQLRRHLQMLEESTEGFADVLATMALMLDGDGSSTTHFDYVTSKYGFESNEAAMAAWNELNSLYSKFNSDNQVSNVKSAFTQAFNKFR